MADAKKAEAAAADAPPKKKGKLLLFIIAGVIALIVIAVAAVFLLKGNSHADEEAADGDQPAKSQKAKKSKKDAKEAPPVFVKLDPFTVKLASENADSYLQTTIELRVIDMGIGDKVKQYMPEIRHRLLLILSARMPSTLETPQGKEKLSTDIRVAINRIIDGPKSSGKKGKEEAPPSDDAEEEDSVQAVLFTSFIIQ